MVLLEKVFWKKKISDYHKNIISDATKWSRVDWIRYLMDIKFAEPPVYNPLWFVCDLFMVYHIYKYDTRETKVVAWW